MGGQVVSAIDVTREEVQGGLADGSLVLVDVREAHEFAAGHIPGSVSLPLSGFDPDALAEFSGRRIVFSCAAGVRSLHALNAARGAGLDLREHYRGGFRDWMMSGSPVEQG